MDTLDFLVRKDQLGTTTLRRGTSPPLAEGQVRVAIERFALTTNNITYGAMGEAMLGFHPTENLTVRFGGRAWYLGGALDATFDGYVVTDHDGDPATDPVVTEQSFIQASDFANLFRYSALFELTGRF